MQDERLLAKIGNEVADAYLKADSKDAMPEDGQHLLSLLKKHPGVLGFALDISGAAIDLVIRQVQVTEASKVLINEKLDRLRKSLSGPEASPTEQLLIDQVVICFLRMNLTEQYYQNAVSDGCCFDTSEFWERKLSTVQRRYLRAIESLARVRKLMGVPMVQINIATEGGKQVVSNS